MNILKTTPARRVLELVRISARRPRHDWWAHRDLKKAAHGARSLSAARHVPLNGNGNDHSGSAGGAAPARPRPIQGDLSKLPDALAGLTALPHWVVWRYEWKDGKWTKPPTNPRTKENASTDDPSTWGTYAEALTVYQSDPDFREFGGIGYMLLTSGHAAFDLDKCRDPATGNVELWAAELIAKAKSYAEISPSGTGFRIIGTVAAGKFKINRRQNIPDTTGKLESYRRCERFITVTGLHVKGSPNALANIDDIMEAEVKRLNHSGNNLLSDDKVKERLAGRGFANRKFADGDFEGALYPKTFELVREGVPEPYRSDKFQTAINAFFWRGFTMGDAFVLLSQHPGGIAEKFIDRLEQEIERSFKSAARYIKNPDEFFDDDAIDEPPTYEEITAAIEAADINDKDSVIRLCRMIVEAELPAPHIAIFKDKIVEKFKISKSDFNATIKECKKEYGRKNAEARKKNLKPGNEPLRRGDHFGNAGEFINDKFMHENQVTLLHHQLTFYVWHQTHFVEFSKEQMKSSMWQYFSARLRVAEDGELYPFDPNLETINNISSALAGRAQLFGDVVFPHWIGGAPVPANEILSCANGLLHLLTRKLLPHTPLFRNMYAINYAYDPNAREPVRWLEFLHQLWPNDQTSIDTLQEIFGLMLTSNTSFQKIFLLIGPKRSGKGTIARVLRALICDINVCSPTLGSLGGPFGIQPLINKVLAIISDARISGKTDVQNIAERLLSISGGDGQTVPRKNIDDWHGDLPTRFMILTNVLPKLTDASGALVSRFITLQLTKSFYGKEDLTLSDKLITECAGILNWSLLGLERLKARGYFIMPCV